MRRYKQYGATIKADGESRRLQIISSTEDVDRDGDIVRQNWRLENYRKSPRIQLWHGPLTIGRSLSEKVAKHDGGPALLQEVEFLPAGVDDVADAQWVMYRDGFLNQWSVGFMPLKITRVDDADERAALGLGRWGVVFEESELYETSAVPIPANPATDTIRVAEKMIKGGALKTHHLDALEHANCLAPALREAWVESKAGVSLPASATTQRNGADGHAEIWQVEHKLGPDVVIAPALDELKVLRKEVDELKEYIEARFAAQDTERDEANEGFADLEARIQRTFAGS